MVNQFVNGIFPFFKGVLHPRKFYHLRWVQFVVFKCFELSQVCKACRSVVQGLSFGEIEKELILYQI